jgi:peptide/nickel transport system permease protein
MAVAEAYAPPSAPTPVRWGKSKVAKSRGWTDWAAISLVPLITLIALLAPVLAPYDPKALAGQPTLPPGSSGFPLGTDSVGRDILSRTLFGVRSSWLSAIAVVLSGLLIGGLVGLIAGTRGGWIDNLLMRFTDLFLALPAPVIAIAVIAALGPSLAHTLEAVAIVWWPFYARIIRGEVRTLAARPHVEAARLSGAGHFRVGLKHLMPGAVPTAVVTASLDIGNLILTLAALSFLGLGQPAPAPELGADTARNLSYLLQDWWIPVIPGIAVLVLSLCSNIAGDGVRNRLQGR